MLGAIAGDIVGSVHEWAATKSKVFPLFGANCRFTDDTVLTVAVADCIANGRDYVETFQSYFDAYPGAGYSTWFMRWASRRHREPYNSLGNGSAMRVSPVAYGFETLESVRNEARRSAVVTHDHPEGIRGAEAVACAVFLARKGASKSEIRDYVEQTFGYPLSGMVLDDIRPGYRFDATSAGSVPHSIAAFLESADFEDALRNAISLGGDADTMACIAGAIAEPFYGGVPAAIEAQVLARLDERLRETVSAFRQAFGHCPGGMPPGS